MPPDTPPSPISSWPWSTSSAIQIRGWWFIAGILAGAILALALWIDVEVRQRPSRFVYEDPTSLPHRSVALVLGAAVLPDGSPSGALRGRLEAGLELYRAHRVDRLLVSGDGAAPEADEAQVMRGWLMERGVASHHILVDDGGVRTIDSMRRAARVFGVSDAVICTQALHLPRALFLARALGIDAVGYRAGSGRPGGAERLREMLARPRAWLDVHVPVL